MRQRYEGIQKSFLYLGGTIGEGFEEYLSEWGNYFANRLLGGSDDRTPAEVGRDAAEAFRDGALTSAIFNTTTLLKKGASPQEAMVIGVEEAAQGIRETAASGRRKGDAAAVSETVGTLSDSLRRKLPEREMMQLNDTLEHSPVGQEYAGILTGLDAAGTTAFTEAVTDVVSKTVKRGEGYSSLQDFLTDGRVSQIMEATLETVVEAVEQPDAKAAGQTGKSSAAPAKRKIDHSGVAVLADKAKADIRERMQNDPGLREAVEQARQASKELFCGTDVDRIIRNVAAGKKMQLPKDENIEIRGNAVIFSGKYGTMGADGVRHPTTVASYADTRRSNRESGASNMQAHHVAQNAIYGTIVAKSEGIAISMPGDVFKDPDSMHNKLHAFLESEMDVYRRKGEPPTNAEYAKLVARSMNRLGINPVVIEYSIYQMLSQFIENGIQLDEKIPLIPKRINFSKKMNENTKGETDNGPAL